MNIEEQVEQFITDKVGPAQVVTMDRGKLALLLLEFVQLFEAEEEPENPQLEAMKDKFNNWLDVRIAKLKAPTNWIDITAEFVLEQLENKEDKDDWADVVE